MKSELASQYAVTRDEAGRVAVKEVLRRESASQLPAVKRPRRRWSPSFAAAAGHGGS